MHEQQLSNHDRDADSNVTGATARVRRTMATCRRTVRSGHSATRIHEQPLPIRERDSGLS